MGGVKASSMIHVSNILTSTSFEHGSSERIMVMMEITFANHTTIGGWLLTSTSAACIFDRRSTGSYHLIYENRYRWQRKFLTTQMTHKKTIAAALYIFKIGLRSKSYREQKEEIIVALQIDIRNRCGAILHVDPAVKNCDWNLWIYTVLDVSHNKK